MGPKPILVLSLMGFVLVEARIDGHDTVIAELLTALHLSFLLMHLYVLDARDRLGFPLVGINHG